MPEIGAANLSTTERARAVQAVADLADGGLAERMRLDAAVRVLVSARRLLALAPREAAAGAAGAPVMRVARDWDPAATTAEEHLEAFAPRDLDAFLSAAPRWAAAVREAAHQPDPFRRAA